MKRDVFIAIGVLLVGTVSAVAANLLRDKPMEWIRTAAPPGGANASQGGPKGNLPVGRPATQPAIDPTKSVNPQAPPVTVPPESPATGHATPYVNLDEVIRLINENRTVFVNAREAAEYDKGHIRYALHVPESAVYENIEQVVNNVPPTDPIVVYCGGGDCEASHVVADVLMREYGYQDVKIYQKGWEEIETSGRFGGLLESEEASGGAPQENASEGAAE